jgi:hypothetical protein
LDDLETVDFFSGGLGFQCIQRLHVSRRRTERRGTQNRRTNMTIKKNAKPASKTTSKTSAQAPSKETKKTFMAVRQEAIEHEAAGRWQQAAESWASAERLAGTKAEHQEAAGRAAAARVRAEASETRPIETPAPAPETVLAEEPARDDAPVQEEASAGTIAPEVIREEVLTHGMQVEVPAETAISGSERPMEQEPIDMVAAEQDAAPVEAPTAHEAPHDAQPEAVATNPGADATIAPTGEAGAPDAAPSEAPAAAVTPAAAPPAAEADKPGKRRHATSQQPADRPARERDERLPPVGTILRRVDRHGNVRCECTIEEGGIRYNGTLYKSLSAAAIAATKDMGLKSKTMNGWSFWGLTKPARPIRDALESLERAWERYRQHAAAAAQTASTEERSRLQSTLHQHASALLELAATGPIA